MYIVFDLEFNRSNRNYISERNGIRLYDEIVQIGAVKLDADRNIIDMFSSFIKPVAYPKMNTEVSRLTGITTEMLWDEGREFNIVIEEFFDWCGNDPVFVTWSGNDIVVLEDNMLYHGIDTGIIPVCYDIQMMFDDQISPNDRDMSLDYAMWALEIDPEVSHEALNDARNTAEVFRRLDMSEGLEGYEV